MEEKRRRVEKEVGDVREIYTVIAKVADEEEKAGRESMNESNMEI